MDPALTSRLKQLYKIQKEIDKLEEEREYIRNDIKRLIVKNRLEGKPFKIGNRYVITYKQKNEYQSLSQDFLLDCYHSYFHDQREGDALLKYVKERRTRTKKYHLVTDKT